MLSEASTPESVKIQEESILSISFPKIIAAKFNTYTPKSSSVPPASAGSISLYGKNVLCEKAFTANAAQAEEILMLAREKDVFVTEAMWVRYMPMLTTIKGVINS